MHFTKEQYDKAIQALQDGRRQLEPDANPCACCGDDGHWAAVCGHNPLFAMRQCEKIARDADVLHETLHALAGCNTYMGEIVGPARVVVPDES